MIHKTSQATCIGLIAILLWGTAVGLTRRITEQLGLVGGAAALYTVSALVLALVLGIRTWKTLPKKYIWSGSFLFVLYELCLSMSIGLATDHTQVIEVGMINYLWPSLTTILAILINKERARWWICIGLLLALLGIVKVLNGDAGLSLHTMTQNISANPFSYFLALLGAVVWAFYCNVTKRYAEGKNGVVLFTALTALALWIIYFCSPHEVVHLNLGSVVELIVAGVAMGAAYGCWNVGILKGNLVLLATASYFTPVLSTVFTAYLLNISLTFSFMQGVVLVTVGSVVCWYATRQVNVVSDKVTA